MHHRAFIRTKDGWFSCVYDGDKEIEVGELMEDHLTEIRSCDYGFALHKDKNQVLVVKNRHEPNVGSTYTAKIDGKMIWLS